MNKTTFSLYNYAINIEEIYCYLVKIAKENLNNFVENLKIFFSSLILDEKSDIEKDLLEITLEDIQWELLAESILE